MKTPNMSCSLIVITESWFLERKRLNQYGLDGYNIFCDSRTKNRGGGVCVYVCQKFEAIELSGHGWRGGDVVP